MENRILIFSPHPDDAEIGMGGTVAKFLDEGWEVILADLTDGEPTPSGLRGNEEGNRSIRTKTPRLPATAESVSDKQPGKSPRHRGNHPRI